MTDILSGSASLWKQRYHLSTAYGIQMALTDPTRGLAISNRSGADQLYTWHVPSGKLSAVFAEADSTSIQGDGLPACTLSPDGAYIYYLQDHHGDETGHFVRVPFTGGEVEDLTPDLPFYTGFLLSLSGCGNRVGFTAVIDGTYFVYALTVGEDHALSQPYVLYTSQQQARGPVFSYDGKVALIEAKRPGSGDFEFIAIEIEEGRVIASLAEDDGGLEAYLPSPVPGEVRFLGISTQSGFERPLLWQPLTGERIELALNEISGDIIPMDWAIIGSSSYLLLRQNVGVTQHIYIYDVASHALHQLDQLASGTYGTTEPKSIFFAPEGDIYALYESSAQPRQFVAVDNQTGTQKRVLLEGDRPLAGHPWQSVTFPSSDGQIVQGWLAQPTGEGPFPTVIELHGGPEFAVVDTFSPSSQSWLDHGFAYLTVNYRGSTSFGKAFQEKIRGNLGYWEIEDVVAARDWLIQQAIACPDQLFLTGWSYGGYLTLLALGKRPGLWAGGMAGLAISDLVLNDEETSLPHLRGLMGGSAQEHLAQYVASSPSSYLEQVDAPVLIIQGLHDTRHPARQIKIYEEKMKALKKDIEVYWFDGGHGSLDIEERIQQQERLLRFAQRVLALK